MKKILILLLTIIPVTAAASRTYQEQTQSNKAVAAFVNDTSASAIAPSGAGACFGSFAFQNKVFGISVGRSHRMCAEQSLALLLDEMGERDKARQILLWQFDDVARRYNKTRYVCKRPVDEHCTTGAAEVIDR